MGWQASMTDQRKTKAQLIEELTMLRRQLAEHRRLEAAQEATEDALRTEKAFLDELFDQIIYCLVQNGLLDIHAGFFGKAQPPDNVRGHETVGIIVLPPAPSAVLKIEAVL